MHWVLDTPQYLVLCTDIPYSEPPPSSSVNSKIGAQTIYAFRIFPLYSVEFLSGERNFLKQHISSRMSEYPCSKNHPNCANRSGHETGSVRRFTWVCWSSSHGSRSGKKGLGI